MLSPASYVFQDTFLISGKIEMPCGYYDFAYVSGEFDYSMRLLFASEFVFSLLDSHETILDYCSRCNNRVAFNYFLGKGVYLSEVI